MYQIYRSSCIVCVRYWVSPRVAIPQGLSDAPLFYDNSTFLSLRNEISDSTAKYVLSISYWDFNLTKEKLLNDMNKRNSYDEL